MGELLVQRGAGGVVTLTLHRPDALNAVTMAVQARLDDVLHELEADPEVRCVVLTGAGDRAFSAGYDVHEMAPWSSDELLLRLLERERWVWHVHATPLPLVVALNGIAHGVGAIMASAADVRVMDERASLKFTAAAHGGANATWTLPELVGRGLAAELLMTSRSVSAEEAQAIGLANRVVPAGTSLEVAHEIAEQIAANPPQGVREVKRLLREHAGRGIEERFVAENLVMRTELRPPSIAEVYEQANTSFVPRADGGETLAAS